MVSAAPANDEERDAMPRGLGTARSLVEFDARVKDVLG